MNQFSISLGRFFGIPASIHWTFWILILFVIYRSIASGENIQETLWYLFFIAVIFTCVVLHELGHALMARRYGIKTSSITILPIGGVASLESIPENPKQELLVAFAGPAVNVVIASVLFIFLLIGGQLGDTQTSLEMTNISSSNFLFAIFSINIVLVIFNMIPAFPMDGGRILRALLAMRMDRVKATEWAVTIGKVFTILFAFMGFFGNPFLVFIALFVFLGANQELNYVKTNSMLGPYTVQDVLMRNYHTLSPNQTLSDAVKILLDGQEEHFLVEEHGELVGILTKENIIKGLNKFGNQSIIRNAMEHELQWLTPDIPLQKVLELIAKSTVKIFPVWEDRKLVGIVDLKNLNEFMQVQRFQVKESAV